MITKNQSICRLAVVLHLCDVNIWSEIKDALSRLPDNAELFILTAESQVDTTCESVHMDFPCAQVYGYSDIDADLVPLLKLMKVQPLEDFDLVLYINRNFLSNLTNQQENIVKSYRANILNQIIPSCGIDRIFYFFNSQPQVGLAVPDSGFALTESSVVNEAAHKLLLSLLKKHEVTKETECSQLFSNDILWARGQVFGALRSLGLMDRDLKSEFHNMVGALDHALDWIFPQLTKSLGLNTKQLPIWDYETWKNKRVPLPAHSFLIRNYLLAHDGGPQILILVVDPNRNSILLELTLDSIKAAAAWGLNVKTLVLRDKSELRKTIDTNSPEWFFVMDAGSELTVSGLLMLVQKIVQNPSALAVYADEMTVLNCGGLEPCLRPDFNLDLLLSCPGFMSHHWLFKFESVNEVGGVGYGDSACIELDIILRLIEKYGFLNLLHVPEPLLLVQENELELIGAEAVLLRHLHARNYLNASIHSEKSGMYYIKYGHDLQPLVSIIIAICDELPVLVNCIETLLDITAYPHYEIIIVDNMSKESGTIKWLDSISEFGGERIRVIRMTKKTNRTHIFNQAVSESRGEYLLFLSHETSFGESDWLHVMLNHIQRPEVSVVGPILFHPTQKQQYAGFVLGLRGVVSRPSILKSMFDSPNACRFLVDQNYSALPDTCFLTKRAIFDELGGFDENLFDEFYADSDFCLKAVSAGYINVWTPFAKVNYAGYVHNELLINNSSKNLQKTYEQQRENFYKKWIDLIANDPAYNVNFSVIGDGFSVINKIEMSNAEIFSKWSPLSWRPLPVMCVQPSDRTACGYYRLIKPFNALKSVGLVDGLIEDRMTISIEAARLKPDVLITQRLISDDRLIEFRKMKSRQDFFFVIDLDDYLLGIPRKNDAKKYYVDKNIAKKIKEGLSLADRFIVSTPGLGEAFDGFHRDIRISELKLPVEWWGGLHSSRCEGKKPRVGWAGGSSHKGDLELVADVVRALADEVHWVFFGMCPDTLRPWVNEVHTGVPIELYPEKLASLNLDLAIAPLEKNIFNDCKSNLRLLEYGACGYPVVCSDARAYRESGLPVTIVKNRFRDWVAAIRMHIHDLDEAQRCGDNLRRAVLSDWMLRGSALDQWRDNWCP